MTDAAAFLRLILADPDAGRVDALIALTYELLDAHADTAQLAFDDASDGEWDNHWWPEPLRGGARSG